MKIAVVGAGAVGCLFGAYLARAGHSVELIGRPALVSGILDHGLVVQGPTTGSFRVAARTALAPDDAPDCVLLTVKTFDLASAASALARVHAAPMPLLLPQNGLGVERTASDALGAAGWPAPLAWTVRAVNSVPATLVAPGVVREGGSGEIVLADPGTAGVAAPHILLFRDLFRGAGLSVRTVDDLEREIWRKAIVNAAINPVTALLGVTNGELAHGSARDQALALLGEARQVARAAGFEFSEKESIADLDRVVHATAPNRSSMLQDLDRGRPTEIASISGEIVRVAEAHGLDVPATRAVIHEVERRVAARRPSPQPS